ncbi:MAG: GIY-YIG nuclease family protein [Candidatus Omnitrophica bacterium]|nr:GIY-YIG nuclease family protein [Candidatus Omnitrophota bacterium]
MKTTYYFYILKCNDGTKYYGHTYRLKERFAEHSSGHVKYTKHRRPIELIYYEKFNSRAQAFMRERQFKNGNTRKKTIEKIINSVSEQNVKDSIRTATYVHFVP